MKNARWVQVAAVTVCAALLAWGGLARSQEAEEMKKQGTEEMAEEEAPQEVTLTGQLVDVTCFAMSGGPPNTRHKMCAMKCAENGSPVGVWDTKAQTITIILAPAPQFAGYMQGGARVTGMVLEEAGALVPSKVEVETEGEWKEVKVKLM